LNFDSTDKENSAALIQNGGEVAIFDSTFHRGTSERGGQIRSENGVLQIESSTFTNNYVTVAGGAIWMNEGDLTLMGSTFDENRSDFLGGAIALLNSTAWVEETTFVDNTGENGGGIGGENSSVSSLNNYFDNNLAEDGGAIGLNSCYDPPEPEETLQIDDCEGLEGLEDLEGLVGFNDEASLFRDNISLHHGGAVFLHGEFFPEDTLVQSTFSQTEFAGNFSGSKGGGLYVRWNISLQIDAVVFTQNESQSAGGGFYLHDSESRNEINASQFERNKTNYSSGGAFFCKNDNDVIVEASSFKNNRSRDSGGAIGQSNGDTLEVRNSFFKNNSTETRSGGAISFEEDFNHDLILEDNEFLNNESGLHGGAIYANQARDIFLLRNTFEGNKTATNAAGGALMFWDQSAVRVHNNLFLNNTAHYGGASYAENTWPRVDGEPSALKVDEWTNNVYRGNEAVWGGALAFLSNPLTDFHNNTLLENTATEEGSGLHLYLSFGRFRSNLFAFSTSGESIVAADSTTSAQATFWNNAFWENTDPDFGNIQVSEIDGNFTADPMLAGGLPGQPPEENTGVLSTASPLINAGDSQLDDPDGSDGDIGARGGPDFNEEDLDEDGYSNQYDCDDQDPATHPGATERWYDGLNQDCSVGSDYDQDQDGARSASYGGPDCNDEDPSQIDNCDIETEPDGCSCSSGTKGGWHPVAWFAMVLFGRRSRRD
jgi:predicted outer membrane repeat protein